MTPEQKRFIYVQYMKMKILEGDWHGVADCANDLRELEAKEAERQRLVDEGS